MALTRSYLGTSTVGTGALAVTAALHYLKKVTLTAGDYLAAVEIYLNTNAGTTVNLKPLLYDDNGGVPGKVIGFSDAQTDTLRFAGTSRWVALPIGYQSAAGQDVWVGFHSSSPGSMTLAYETSGGDDRQVSQGSNWTSEPGTYATAVDPGSHLYSIRASVISGMTATRLGRTSVGGSWLAMNAGGGVHLRSITVPANSVLASVACHVRHSVANVVTISGFVWDDNGGVPGKLLMGGSNSNGTTVIFLSPGRWLHYPVGIWCPSSTTLWVGMQMYAATSFDLAYDATGSDGGVLAGLGDASTWTSGDDDYSIHGVVLS